MKAESWFYKIVFTAWMVFVFAGNVRGAEVMPSGGEEYNRQAAEVFAFLDQQNSYAEGLSVADMNVLPVGISRTVSNVRYTIAVSSIRFMQEYAELTVWGRVELPQGGGNRVLFFGAQEIKLSNEGDIVGDARLVLLGNVGIPINNGAAELTLKGGFNPATGVGDKQTYMVIDCQGYRELGLAADLVLSDSLVRKVDAAGRFDSGDPKVRTSFSTIIRDWNDLVVAVNLPNFEIVGLKDFIFDVERVVFDFSDSRSVDDVRYPAGYQEQYMIPGNLNLWKGIYIGRLSVTLPPQFSSRQDSTKRISFQAGDMIFDDNGISGVFEAENILAFENGSAGGWPFSVERFSISLIANNLNGAGFGGRIGLPVADKSPLLYDAYISPDNEYLLRVSKADTMNFSIWAAQAQLLPNSYVELKVKGGRFRPEAMLSGSLSVRAGVGDSGGGSGAMVADLQGIKFRQMHLATEAPYFTVEYLGYDGEFSLKGFPLSVGRIALQTRGTEAALGFDAKVALGNDPFAIAADTRLEVVGRMEQERGLQSWKYTRLDLSAIRIESSFAGVFSVTGSLTLLNDDPVYGDGFAGNVALKFDKCLKGVEIKARAIFGQKDFRYWFVDGSMMFGKAGLPVFPPVKLSGIGGGAYYRMAQRGMGETALPTGTVYVPDRNRGFGFKAAALVCVGKPDVISGDVSFEIAFNDKGGLAYMGFFGQMKVLGEIPGFKDIEGAVKNSFDSQAKAEKDYLASHPGVKDGLNQLQKYKLYEPTAAAKEIYCNQSELGKGGFLAAAGIQYDFEQNVLHATCDLYVNVLGGLIKGRGQNNNAGHTVLHIEQGNWYLHLGTPTNRLGVEIDLLHLIRIKSGAYFMTGSKIEGSPAPPQQVADILGVELQKLDYMRDLNALGEGGGFAFGADFSVGTGDITFLILYANFQAGLGFDIMLKDYGEAQCNGRRGPVGIDGWYANGQAYGYLQGEAGINLKLLFIKKKIPIIKAGAATLFQAKLPNPAWFAGYLGVKFDLLGGLVKGRIRLKISFGEECELVTPGGSPLGFPVINDIKPEDQSKGVDVFAAPQVAFNMPVGKPFELEEDEGPKSYRLRLEEFSVSENGKVLDGRQEWNANRDAVSFYSHEVLPPEAELKVVARVCFEEWRNGRWEVVYTGGQKAYEQMEAAFSTGTAPENIPLHNIEYCYPVKDQQYFLAGESSDGYIQLKRGQRYLFASEYTHEVRFDGGQGNGSRVGFRYDTGQNRLVYAMPQVDGGTGYVLNVTVVPKEGGESDVMRQQDKQLGDQENEVTLRTNMAAEVVMTDVGKVLLDYSFKTSRYRTLAEKMRGMVLDKPAPARDDAYFYLRYMLKETEPFDVVDLVGSTYSGNRPLLSAEAVLDDAYYRNVIYPLVYEKYPYPDGIDIRVRDVNVYGVPPVRAIPVDNQYLTQIENGIYYGVASQFFPYTYNLYGVYAEDYYDLRDQLANRYLNKPQLSFYETILNSYFPKFDSGSYKIIVKYGQPDLRKGSASHFNFIY